MKTAAIIGLALAALYFIRRWLLARAEVSTLHGQVQQLKRRLRQGAR